MAIIGEYNPIQQGFSDTCAIKSQQIILSQFGYNLSEHELVELSLDMGFYNGNGTCPQDVGKLLDLYHIPTTMKEGASIYDLVAELAQGHKVIVGVDSDELWNGGIRTVLKDIFIGHTPDHALIVAGIDTTDPNHIQVLLTDPGSGDYCKSYPLEQFMDAWKDSNCFMVSTDVTPPVAYCPEMIHFDYTLQHIPCIGQIPYDRFMEYVVPLADELAMEHTLHMNFYDEFSQLFCGDIAAFSSGTLDSSGFFPAVLETEVSSFEPVSASGYVMENEI